METLFESLYKERTLVASGMITRGGSFVKCLGLALRHADGQNIWKIKKTWPEEWNTYLQIGIAGKKAEEQEAKPANKVIE